MLSAVLMLDWMGEARVSKRITDAVHEVLEAGTHVTRDLGGTADTATFTHALIDAL